MKEHQNNSKNKLNFTNHFKALFQKAQLKREAKKLDQGNNKLKGSCFGNLFKTYLNPGNFFNHRSGTFKKNKRKGI